MEGRERQSGKAGNEGREQRTEQFYPTNQPASQQYINIPENFFLFKHFRKTKISSRGIKQFS